MFYTGNQHKYVKFWSEDQKEHVVPLACGFVEDRSEKQVIHDFCDTLGQPWMWTENTKKIWIDSGVINYKFDVGLEYTNECFRNIRDGNIFRFPPKTDFLMYLNCHSNHLMIDCAITDIDFIPIDICVFTGALNTYDLSDIINKLSNKAFVIESPKFIKIPFSDKYSLINNTYRRELSTKGKLTIID